MGGVSVQNRYLGQRSTQMGPRESALQLSWEEEGQAICSLPRRGVMWRDRFFGKLCATLTSGHYELPAACLDSRPNDMGFIADAGTCYFSAFKLWKKSRLCRTVAASGLKNAASSFIRSARSRSPRRL